MDAAISFSAGTLFVLPVLITASSPGQTESLVGLLGAGGGVGGFIGALAAGTFVNRRSSHGLIAGVVVAAVSLAVLATNLGPALAVAAVALLSGAIVQLDTLNMTELQRTTDSRRLGRTLGVLHTLAAGWIMTGSIVAGALTGVLGVGPAILICALVVAMLGGGAVARSSPRFGPASFAPASIGVR